MLCDVEGISIFSSFTIPIVFATLSSLKLLGCWIHSSIGSDFGVMGVFFRKKWLRVFASFLRPFCLAALPLIIIAGVWGEIGGDSKFEWHNFCLEMRKRRRVTNNVLIKVWMLRIVLEFLVNSVFNQIVKH